LDSTVTLVETLVSISVRFLSMVYSHQKFAIPEDLYDPKLFNNRELSWLEFNKRVLAEVYDERNPLLERLKFSAIFSNNLDEFFMVRVSGLEQQKAAQVTKRTPDGLNPEEQLEVLSEHLHPVVSQQARYFEEVLRPLLVEEGIYILDHDQLDPGQKQLVRHYFEEMVFPVLTPLAVDPSHPFPYLSNLSLSLAVMVRDPEGGMEHFARVKVPQKILPRFVAIGTQQHYVPLEQIIAAHLDELFHGMEVLGSYPFRITRNADMALEEEEADDLLLMIEQGLRTRRFGDVVRLEVPHDMPPSLLTYLMEAMELSSRDVYPIHGLLDHDSLFSLCNLPFAHLKYPPHAPAVPTLLQNKDASIFSLIRRGDLFVHHPYDSFASSVERFVAEAAADPKVLAIKQTLYRTSGDSPVVQSLIRAAEDGKQVACLVELKARFDEENNINWAKALEKAGVHVAYGLIGLKTHSKLALVVRREGSGIRRYVHIGTGNYNSKTARLYTDFGLFTCDPAIGADATDLFNFLTGYVRKHQYQKLLVAPISLRSSLIDLIQREVQLHHPERPGRIIAKMNSLVDPELIRNLYYAAQHGVQIDLIVRGVCVLKPGIAGVSESIRVTSVIGRFLEHSRVFYFQNGGEEELYIGSADWMTRNMDRRVEVVAPIQSDIVKQKLLASLQIYLEDNYQSWELHDSSYTRRYPEPGEEPRPSQARLIRVAEEG